MDNPSQHPGSDLLVAFGMGRLAPEEASSIETHLDECPECCETLLDLKDDTFVALLRTAPHVPPAGDPVAGAGADSRTDGPDGKDESSDATLVLSSGRTAGPDKIPAALVNHPRYEVVALIGRGGMGDVYKAEHRLMNRTVALKVINQELTRNPHAVQRFHREVQAAARLTHPNIVTAYDAEQAGETHYLVMEYVGGTNLAEMIKDQGPLDLNRACDYIQQVAIGLQHAHEQVMVHRDIKPHNLMVTPAGQVKILDFGLATLTRDEMRDANNAPQDVEDGTRILSQDSSRSAAPHHLTTAGTMMGTPDFISPEQAGDARNVDIRSDIYSLGCTFYYLLTGRPPFDEGSVVDRVSAHRDREPVPIRSLRADVPDDLADVLRRMMAKDPAERFQSPAEVADALAPFVDKHRTAEPPTPNANSRRGTGHGRWPMIAAILLPLLIGLAGIIYVATDRGTLVIESVDDSVQIVLSQVTSDAVAENSNRKIHLKLVDFISGSTVKVLRSGSYFVSIQGQDTEFELNQDRFVLKRGDKVIVRVTRRPAKHLDAPENSIAPNRSIATAETRAAFQSVLSAVREASSDADWNRLVANSAPVLMNVPLESSRGLLTLLVDLPAKSREALLQEGYLRWRGDALDKQAQSVLVGLLADMNSRAAKDGVTPLGRDHFEQLIPRSDVGFVVLDLPDSNDQAVGWYLLDRELKLPSIILVSGSSISAVRDLMKQEVRNQVTALLEKPYSDDVWQPAATPQTTRLLNEVIAAADEATTDEQWQSLYDEYSPPLAQFPVEVGRDILELLSELPSSRRTELLQTGYLKWKVSDLAEPSRQALQQINRQISLAWMKDSDFGREHADQLARQMDTMIDASDVGFAIVNPKPDLQAVVWYMLMPHSPVPMMLPVCTTGERGADFPMRPVHEHIMKLKDEPYSLPLERRATTRQTRQAIETLVKAAQQAGTPQEWDSVLAEHAPMLALTDDADSGSEQFGKQEMAHYQAAGRSLVEVLTQLPDEVLEDLLQTGYVKWKFADLDESRQAAMRNALTNLLAASSKMGFPAELQSGVPQMLNSGNVGFLIIDVPDSDRQLLSWYLLMPTAPLPIMFPIVGSGEDDDAQAYSKAAFKQLGELDEKPYSDLKSLFKPADLRRLQGVWNFIRGEANGKPATPRTLEIAANVWLVKDPQTGRTIERMTFEIDPTQEPKHITLTMAAASKPINAIYRIDGDELSVAAASVPGRARPGGFDEGGEGNYFFIMRREPPPNRERMLMEEALRQAEARQDASHSIAYAVWEADGKPVLRFTNWLLVFEGIDVPSGFSGLGALRVPHKKYDDSKRTGGGATFGTEKSPFKVTINDRIVDDISTVSVNEFEFKLQGRAETLAFCGTRYAASDDVQTIVIRASGESVRQ